MKRLFCETAENGELIWEEIFTCLRLQNRRENQLSKVFVKRERVLWFSYLFYVALVTKVLEVSRISLAVQLVSHGGGYTRWTDMFDYIF